MGRGAIREVAWLRRCDFAFAFGRPLRAQTQTFGSGYPPVGWGSKSSVCPSDPGKPNFLAGYPGFFLPGHPGGCPKSLRKKVCVQFLAPYYIVKVFLLTVRLLTYGVGTVS